MEPGTFLDKLKNSPDEITFDYTMSVIDNLYDFTPVSFTNGNLVNAAGQNSGSCKLFAFAKLQALTEQQTLACFGDYYRKDVLKHPNGNDHQNIRNFIRTGWEGIAFDTMPLTLKKK